MIKITIKETKLDSQHADYVENLAGLALQADLRNAKKETFGENVVYHITDNKLSLDLAKQLHALGVQIEDMPLFIDTSADCPFTYTDEDEVEQSYTWETWKRDDHTFIETTDNKTYLHTSAGTGVNMSIQEVVDAGLIDSVIDLQTLKAKLPVDNEV